MAKRECCIVQKLAVNTKKVFKQYYTRVPHPSDCIKISIDSKASLARVNIVNIVQTYSSTNP